MGNDNKVVIEEIIEEGAPEWTTTFGDMMSLLLCFFILLFSMSVLDMNKYNAALKSLQSALNVKTEKIKDMPSIKSDKRQDITDVFQIANNEMEKIAEKMNMFIEDQHIKSQVKVIQDERGVVIKIDAKIMYGLGKAEIKQQSIKLVSSIGDLLKTFKYAVRVEGHTDNLPINSAMFPSNWELSSARATSVVRHFIKQGIEPDRLAAEGFAQYRPQTSNATETGRAKNRRVEIVFRKEDIVAKIETEIKRKEQEKQIETEVQ